jgi:hypothetical protein
MQRLRELVMNRFRALVAAARIRSARGNAGTHLVANIGGRPLQCGTCRHHFCHRGSCLTSTMDCNWCGILSCATYKQVKQCCSCRVSGSKTCGDVGSCDNSAKLYCYECLYDRGGRSCDGCSKDLCVDCVHDWQNRLFNFCEGCMTRYCIEAMPQCNSLRPVRWSHVWQMRLRQRSRLLWFVILQRMRKIYLLKSLVSAKGDNMRHLLGSDWMLRGLRKDVLRRVCWNEAMRHLLY